MKKLIIFAMALTLLLSGCGQPLVENVQNKQYVLIDRLTGETYELVWGDFRMYDGTRIYFAYQGKEKILSGSWSLTER